jgi:hypothetical protein
MIEIGNDLNLNESLLQELQKALKKSIEYRGYDKTLQKLNIPGRSNKIDSILSVWEIKSVKKKTRIGVIAPKIFHLSNASYYRLLEKLAEEKELELIEIVKEFRKAESIEKVLEIAVNYKI